MVYLDYAATAPLLPEVREAMREAEEKFFANASALHTPGHLAHNVVEECRETLAEMIGAKPEEIVFTSGASEVNNTVMHIFEGHEIETSPLEHHSVLEAARAYRGEKKPKLYSYMLVNNETGEILELPKVRGVGSRNGASVSDQSAVHSPDNRGGDWLNDQLLVAKNRWGKPLVTDKRPAYLHSDLTQVLGKMPIDVSTLGLDYATFSAHKIGGPVGVGALYVRQGVPFRPFLIGGLQENGRRAGTYNVVGLAGFLAAMRAVQNARASERYDIEIRKLRDDLAARILAEIPGSSLNTDLTPGKSLPSILNASFEAAEGESIQLYLDAEGIVVSTGSACAAGDTQPSHVLMAKTGDAEVAHSSIRFSFGLGSSAEDVSRVMEVLPGIVARLQGMSTIERKTK